MKNFRSCMVREMLKIMIKPQDRLKQSIIGQRLCMDMFSMLLGTPRDVVIKDTDMDGINSLLIFNPNASENHVILFLHGGAFDCGSPQLYRRLAASLSKYGHSRVFLPDYRLAPEYPFPMALEDSLAAYRYLVNHGTKSSNIIIAGDSAGGGLAVSTVMSLRDKNQPLPAGIICISPWADLDGKGRSRIIKADGEPLFTKVDVEEAAVRYAGKEDLKNPLISPVYGDFYGFPPILIQVGSEELLLSDSEDMAEKASSAGVDVTLEVWSGMWHVWHIFGRLVPESRKALQDIGLFARKCFKGN